MKANDTAPSEADYAALLLDELTVISNCALSALRLMTLAPHRRDRVIVDDDDGTITIPDDPTPKATHP